MVASSCSKAGSRPVVAMARSGRCGWPPPACMCGRSSAQSERSLRAGSPCLVEVMTESQMKTRVDLHRSSIEDHLRTYVLGPSGGCDLDEKRARRSGQCQFECRSVRSLPGCDRLVYTHVRRGKERDGSRPEEAERQVRTSHKTQAGKRGCCAEEAGRGRGGGELHIRCCRAHSTYLALDLPTRYLDHRRLRYTVGEPAVVVL